MARLRHWPGTTIIRPAATSARRSSIRGTTMHATHRRAGLLAALAALSLGIAACGGATTTTDEPTGTPTDAPTEAPSDGPPASEPAASDPAIVLPSFDPTAIYENLEGVDSYRVVVSTDGEVSYSAVVVTKPELARDITLGDSPDDDRIVVIGDEAWMGSGDALEPVPPAMSTAMLAAFDPMIMFGGFAQAGAWGGAEDLGTENRNGIDAQHFRIDGSTFAGTIPSMPEGASIDAWIATDGGYLVGLEIVGEGGTDGFTVDVSDVNDPSLRVERPS